MLALLLASLAFATLPEPELVWSSEGRRVRAHCLLEDGRWAALQLASLTRGPEITTLDGAFGKHTLVIGKCKAIAYANDRETAIHLIDPWTGTIHDIETGVQFVQMAVSPDGAYVLVGGWDDGDQVVLVDVQSGEARRLTGAVSHADWRWSPDGSQVSMAKSWKSSKAVVRDVLTLERVEPTGALEPAERPTEYSGWQSEWELTKTITARTTDLGSMSVSSFEKRTTQFPMAVHKLQPLPDESLLLYRQQTTRSGGISMDIFHLPQARPQLLRWYLETPE
ncbi:MAG: hypothetical protein EP330_08330 [Deltaproteobacteria bacterium]|nr:MAG: hypothetical protein EP330_08330 [Deltaproteobacteria bacterium]